MKTGFLTLGQMEVSLSSSYQWVHVGLYPSDNFSDPIIVIGLNVDNLEMSDKR